MLSKSRISFILGFIFVIFLSGLVIASTNCPSNANSEESFKDLLINAVDIYLENETANADMLPKIKDLIEFYLKTDNWDIADCSQKGSNTGLEIFVVAKNIDMEIRQGEGLPVDTTEPIITIFSVEETSMTVNAVDEESGVDYIILGEKLPGDAEFRNKFFDCNKEKICSVNNFITRRGEGVYEYQASVVNGAGLTSVRSESKSAGIGGEQPLQNQTCAGLGGFICTGNQSCNGSIRTASDGVCCMGNCVEETNETCTENSDCGISGARYYCQGNNIMTYNITFVCLNATGECLNLTTNTTQVASCTGNFTCVDGQSSCQEVECQIDADCLGSIRYGSLYCSSGNVYKNKTQPRCQQQVCQNITTAVLNKTCLSGQTCSAGQCVACTPATCASLGKNCGSWNNGTCAGTLNCGSCSSGYTCSAGTCVEESCTPNCVGKVCGSNGCGGSCGSCGSGYVCSAGSCVASGDPCAELSAIIAGLNIDPPPYPKCGDANYDKRVDYDHDRDIDPNDIYYTIYNEVDSVWCQEQLDDETDPCANTCSVASDCGTNSLDGYACYGGHVYGEGTFYTCPAGICVTETSILVDECVADQYDSEGNFIAYKDKCTSWSVNNGKCQCWADFNDDGDTDSSDQAIFSSAYGSNSSSPNWNPKCDLNNDGKVDFLDVGAFSSNYGCTAEQSSPLTGSAVKIPEKFNIWEWFKRISGFVIKRFVD